MADAAATPADPKGKGKKKILGMPPWALGLGIAVTAGGIIFFLYERHKQAAAAAAGSGADTGTPAGTDQSGQISTLQTEIGDLQGQEAGEGKDPDPGTGPIDIGGGDGGPPKSVPWDQNAVNLAADAKQALIKEGVKNPTQAQIAEERQDIIRSARAPGPRHPNARHPRPRPRPRRRRRHARR